MFFYEGGPSYDIAKVKIVMGNREIKAKKKESKKGLGDSADQTCFHRGQLWISWEEGMKVFDELLLDTDWSVNAGTWMWLSCSSFFQQFFHLYCPVEFGRRADPGGDYIR